MLNAFNERLVKGGAVSRDAGRLLKHAEAFRYVADYSDNAVEFADAREIVAQAEMFVANLQSLLNRNDPDTEQSSGMTA
ncbi:hypothetical protein [Rhodopila globiformis]|uniref:hypothetical protein n=1 Tax=Rhodopila globiformis TaxID=1071 RepID=UPI001957C759|nr:hypothetical protein [Rhodopila globiformis]